MTPDRTDNPVARPSDAFQPLAGRVAVVTGASRGIGRAVAEALAGEGAAVTATARDPAALAEVAATIVHAGGRACVCPADLRDPATPGALVAATLEAFGTLDILVNNAGATRRGRFLDLTDDDWADGFALKFFGSVRLTRAAWPHLRAAGGSLVNIVGVGGRTPGAEFAIGGSVNAGLLSLTKALADQGIADGVQVNAINPGAVRTDRLNARLDRLAQERGITTEAAADALVREAHTVRLGEPADIARLVAFLVHPASRFIHGALLDADGGQTKSI